MTNEVQTYQAHQQEIALRTPQQVIQQLQAVQSLMKEAMVDKQDYGTIPGCGDKPTLLKPGAEKLCAMFRLGMKIVSENVKDLAGGHREYETTAEVFHQPTGCTVCHGVGVATTMESKHRFRTGGGEVTGLDVPKSYWDTRRDNHAEAAKQLAQLANEAGYDGTKFGTKKDDAGMWKISTFGDKIENDNPADCYNTVRKMAKKRAFVDAVITATNASCIFTQDIEDTAIPPQQEAPSQPPSQANYTPRSNPPTPPPTPSSDAQKGVEYSGTINEVVVLKEGNKNGRTWVKLGIVVTTDNGVKTFATFDKGMADYAAAHAGQACQVRAEQNKYKELEALYISAENMPSSDIQDTDLSDDTIDDIPFV